MPNHLIDETSPYLLQHAHNPVDWYPWGEEALTQAKKEDKPILVSIGYSACHWCHVMERESFENEDTAVIMNQHFINIKIDREERPDLDHIYMDAVQAISGSGGWPLNVFLTPDAKPFYGGTYFPPIKAFNRSSWTDVLQAINNLFKEKREEVESKAEELTQYLRGSIKQPVSSIQHQVSTLQSDDLLRKEQVDTIYQNIMKQADTVWGGFGNAPKFPQTFTINYLFRYHFYNKDEASLAQALLSLDKMIDGGLYDHVGGAFARYSTDREWLAPHFEKMLYDNALLLISLSEAYQITMNERYKRIIQQTIEFTKRELAHPDGGFYSALDADSEGLEGKYYVWSYDEVKELLGRDADLFCEYYDITPQGNWEHHNILRILKPFPQFAQEKNINADELRVILDNCLQKLLIQRQTRIRPGTDDKIILGWNALMISALCKASAATQEQSYNQLAVDTYEFLISKFSNPTTNDKQQTTNFFHTYKNNIAKYSAFLDDYAYLINAAIHLQEVTSDSKYLEDAQQLTEYVIDNFSDENGLFFFYTNINQLDVIVRKKEIYDGAIPSANAIMAYNLNYLSIINDKPVWRERSISMLLQLQDMTVKYPTSFGNWASLLLELKEGTKEVVITGNDYAEMRDALLSYFVPARVIQCAKNSPVKPSPLLVQKEFPSRGALFYLCKNYQCDSPTSDFKSLINRLLI
jgi:uncharacterized protein